MSEIVLGPVPTGSIVLTTGGGGGGPVSSAQITDATAVGRAVLTAADAATARAAIGAAAVTVTDNGDGSLTITTA